MLNNIEKLGPLKLQRRRQSMKNKEQIKTLSNFFNKKTHKLDS